MPYKRKFDFIWLWDEEGMAFDADKYSKEEAIEKYKLEKYDPSEEPTCVEQWARSEVVLWEGEFRHAYILYDVPVKRSFKVWQVR